MNDDALTATYQRTETVPLDELTPFPGNAQRGDVGAILESLRRNGQYRSLIVREIEHGPRIILAGNHTSQALTAHGPGDCGQTTGTGKRERTCGVCGNDPDWKLAARCEFITCDDHTARTINLADNRIPTLGTTDTDALAELFSYMGEDYEGTGYSPQDVKDITDLIAVPDDELDDGPTGTSDGDDPGHNPAFMPEIRITVTTDTFDRWRLALDAHDGKDDTDKLLGLLGEIEEARAAA